MGVDEGPAHLQLHSSSFESNLYWIPLRPIVAISSFLQFFNHYMFQRQLGNKVIITVLSLFRFRGIGSQSQIRIMSSRPIMPYKTRICFKVFVVQIQVTGPQYRRLLSGAAGSTACPYVSFQPNFRFVNVEETPKFHI